jgi:hypothetical protein
LNVQHVWSCRDESSVSAAWQDWTAAFRDEHRLQRPHTIDVPMSFLVYPAGAVILNHDVRRIVVRVSCADAGETWSHHDPSPRSG